MIEVVKHITGGKGSNVFLFTTAERLVAAGPLGTAWLSGKGQTMALT